MTLLALKEDRPTPKAVYNWRVYVSAAIASFASCMIGYDSAFIGTTIALDSFREEFGFDKLSTSQCTYHFVRLGRRLVIVQYNSRPCIKSSEFGNGQRDPEY